MHVTMICSLNSNVHENVHVIYHMFPLQTSFLAYVLTSHSLRAVSFFDVVAHPVQLAG